MCKYYFSKLLVFLIGFYSISSSLEASLVGLSSYEAGLVHHVMHSIEQAEKGVSKLTSAILALDGMSSSKGRHLMNNLCSLPNTRYLEIGTWAGSTWVSALYHNKTSVCSAIAIDNWSEFEGPKDKFEKNCNRFLKNYSFQFFEVDCFQLDLNTVFRNPVNLYFYDGGHSKLDQERAFTYYNSVLDHVFIAIVDDWNWSEVAEGTYSAFEKLNYEVLYEQVLPARWNGDRDNWWNGMYVAVIRKPAL